MTAGTGGYWSSVTDTASQGLGWFAESVAAEQETRRIEAEAAAQIAREAAQAYLGGKQAEGEATVEAVRVTTTAAKETVVESTEVMSEAGKEAAIAAADAAARESRNLVLALAGSAAVAAISVGVVATAGALYFAWPTIKTGAMVRRLTKSGK